MNRSFRTSLQTAALAALLGVTLSQAACSNQHTSTAPAPTAGPAVVQRHAGPAPEHVGAPTRIRIPVIGVDIALTGVGLKPDGAMQTPAFGAAGWYRLGARPGARGAAVVVAHVHGPDGDDVFADLHRLRPGDVVRVDRTDGSSRFVVETVEKSPKEALPVHRIWTTSDRALLRLITCGGTPDPVTRMYPDNTVVYLHEIR